MELLTSSIQVNLIFKFIIKTYVQMLEVLHINLHSWHYICIYFSQFLLQKTDL